MDEQEDHDEEKNLFNFSNYPKQVQTANAHKKAP